MKRAEDNKWLDDVLTEAIGREKPDTSFEQWKRNHPEAVEMLTSRARKASPAVGPQNIWSKIMKSRITKVAAAAVIVVGVFAAINAFWGTNNMALADVVERIEQVKTYACQMSATFKGQNLDNVPISQATVLIARDIGMKTNIQIRHPLTGQSMLEEIYVLLPKKTVTTLMPNEKKYSRKEFDETSFEGWQKEYDPRFLVEGVLKCEHTPLGGSTMNGIEVEGFQTTDPNYMGGTMGQANVKIWADVKTRLPVRIEIDKSEADKGHLHMVVSEFQWDVPVDAAEFEPVIPDDYVPGKPMLQLLPKKNSAVNEEAQ